MLFKVNKNLTTTASPTKVLESNEDSLSNFDSLQTMQDGRVIVKGMKRRIFTTALVPTAVLLLIISFAVWKSVSSRQDDPIALDRSTPFNELEKNKLPAISGFTEASPVDEVVFNERVSVNGTIVVSPSLQPTQAVSGQLYFDSAKNSLRLFDGTNYRQVVSITDTDQICFQVNNCGYALASDIPTIPDIPDAVTLPQDLAVTASPTFSGLTLSNDLSVSNGGTGTSTFANNAVLLGAGTGALTATNTPLSGELLIASASGVPQFVSLSGDATISSSGVINLGTNTVDTNELVDTSVTAGTYGSVTDYPVFTVDADGRITSASTLAVPGGGSGVGSLNTLVGALTIQGTSNQISVVSGGSTITLSTPQDIATTSSPTFNGLTLTSLLIGGDTLTELAGSGLTVSAGALQTTLGIAVDGSEITNGSVANADLANSSLTVTAGTGLSGGGAVSLGGTVTLNLANDFGSSIDSSEITNGTILFADLNDNGCGNQDVIKWNGSAWTCAADSTGSGTNTFATISAPSGTSPVADSTSDTLTLLNGAGVSITGNSTTDEVTIAAVLGADVSGSELVDGTIEEVDLEVTNSATDNYVLTFDSASGGFTWVDPTTVGLSYDFDITDGTTTQTLSNGDVFTFVDGSNIDAVVTATDTVTINLSSTPTISGLTTLNGGLTIQAGDNFIFNGDTLTDLTGTGLTLNGTTLEATLGTAIDTGEITNGTILFADLNDNGCGNQDVIKWNGSAWTCAADSTGSGTNTFATISAPSGTSPVADSTSDTLTLLNGAGVSITGNSTTDEVTIAAVLGADVSGSELVDGTIEEVDLEVTNSATDNYVLTFDSASGGFTWVDPTTVGLSYDFDITDGTTTQTLSNGDVFTFVDGSNIDAVVTATDTVTINLSSTPTISGLTTLNGGLTIQAGDNFIFNGDTLTDLTGTGLTLNGTTLEATLGTAIDTGEITNGTILFADLNDNGCGNQDVIKWNGSAWTCAADSTGSGTNTFGTIATSNGTSPVADSTTDTLTLADGAGITITGNSTTDEVTIAAVLGADVSGSELVDGTIEEVDLEVTNSATDNYVLTFDSASGGFTWVDPTTVGLSYDFDITDGTTTQTLSNGDVFTFVDGSNIDAVVTATDTVTINLSSTPTISGLTTLNGGLTIQAGDNFIFNGDTLTDLTGTGLTLNGTTLEATLGTAIDTGEITNGTILFADLNDNGCGNQDVIKWNGSAWTCAADSTGSGTNTFATISAPSGTSPVADSTSDTLTLLNGAGVSITGNSTTDEVTIAAVLGADVSGSELVDGTIEEVDLEVTNSATDNYVLTFDSASGGFTWVDPTTVGLSYDFDITDGTTTQTLSNGDVFTFVDGSNIDAVVTATDTVTINLSSTPTISGLTTLNGGLTIQAGDTFTFNGDAFTDLTGTGLTINTGVLEATLGTAIDTSEITNATILFADIAQNGCTNDEVIKWNGSAWICGTDSTGSGTNTFGTIATSNGTSPVADSTTDTLTLADGAGITITGNSTTDTVTIAAVLGTDINLASAEVTGTLAVTNGGTGATSTQGAINALSQLTTNGDLLYFNGTNSTRLGRGSNGQCLQSDSTTILWTTCAGSGTTFFTLAGTSGTPQNINGGDTLTIAAGSNITTTAGATDTLTVAVSSSPTFSGDLTVQGNTTIGNATTDRITFTSQVLGGSPLVFQGATDNSFETTIAVVDPTGDRTITLPDADGTVCLTSGNCAGVGGTGDILNNGQNGTVRIGSNNANSTILESNGTDRLTIDSTGAANFTGNLSVDTDTLYVDSASDFVAIGSASAANSRLNVASNAGASDSGSIIQASGTLGYATGAGELQYAFKTFSNVSPSSAASGSYFGGVFGPQGTSTTNLTNATIGGVYGLGTYTGTSGTLDRAVGGRFTVQNSGNGTGIIDEAFGVQIVNFSNPFGTINDRAGLQIDGFTTAFTDATLVLLGTNTIPAGDFSIYNASAQDNVFQGNLTVGSTTAPTVALDVTGDGLFSGNLTVNGNTTFGNAVTDNLTVTAAIQGTSALLFDGSTNDTNETTLSVTNPTTDRTITLPDQTGTVVLDTTLTTEGDIFYRNSSAVTRLARGSNGQCLTSNTTTIVWATCDSTVGYILQVPGSTAQNTITPTANSVVGLTVNGTSGTAATAVNIVQTGAAASLAVSNSNASTTSIATITGTNTSGTQTNGLLIERNGASGTTTNLLNLTQTSGTATNGLSFNGSFGTSIYFANGSGSIGTTSSGYVNIQGGTSGVTINASNTNSGTSGGLTLASGTNSSTGNSGAVSMASGSVQTGNSGGITLATGSVGFSGISGNITISTGDTNGGGGGTPGSISVDTGFISGGSTSQINIGTSNSRNNTLGNTQNSTVTTIRGGNTTTALNLAVATNGYLNLNNTGVANVIQIGTTTGAVAQTINIGNNTTASSNNQITIGSTIGSSQVTLQGNVAINNLSSTSGTTFVCRNASSLFSSCTNTPLTNALQDNIADAFDLQQGSDNYINIRTSDGTENISFGNATTNPSYSFLGTGTVTLAGDLAVNGDDITSDGNLTVNATGYVRIGDTGTPGVASGDDDLYVESDLEVDATATIAGNLTVSGLQTLDSSANSGINHISIRNSNAGSSATGGLQFGQDTSATVSYIFQNSSTNTGWGGSNSFNILNTFNAPIVLHTNSAERLRLTGAGDAYFNGTASTSQLEVRDGTSTTVTLLVADSTNDRVYIGDTSTDTTGTLLVLDVKTDSGDPTGVAGAMYFNSNSNSFRCRNNSAWSDCTGSGSSKWQDDGSYTFLQSTTDRLYVGIGTADDVNYNLNKVALVNTNSSSYNNTLKVYGTNTGNETANLNVEGYLATTSSGYRTFNTYHTTTLRVTSGASTGNEYIGAQFDLYTDPATNGNLNDDAVVQNIASYNELGDGSDTDAISLFQGIQSSGYVATNFTVDDYQGLVVYAPTVDGDIGRYVGALIQQPSATDALPNITDSINILIQDPDASTPSGEWSIYNSSAFDNYFEGDLAIGTGGTAPSYALDVADSQSTSYVARIQNTNTANTADGLLIDLGVANGSRANTNYFVGFAGAGTVAGKIQGGASAVAYTTTAADYAEYFKTDANNKPQAAELVTLDPSDNYAVKRSNGPATTPIVGAISTNPGFIGNGPICAIDDNNCDANYANYNALVALSGQVPVLVDNSNGAIAIGDPITSSNIAGRGAKATSPSYIVGYAMEPFNGTSGSIRVLIRPEYYSPTPTSILAQDVTTTSLAVSGTASINNLNVTNDLAITNNITVSGDAIFSGNVTVAGITQLQTLVVSGDTSVQNITINGKIISQGNTPTAVLGEAVIVGQGSVVAVTGNDTAGSLSYTSGSVNLPSYNVTNGAQVEVQFSEAYAQVPRIALTAKGSSSASVRYYVETTTSGFTVYFIDAPQGSTTYTFDYIVIQ